MLFLILPASRPLPPLRVNERISSSAVRDLGENAAGLLLVRNKEDVDLQHVRPKMRRKGFGTALLDAAKRIGSQLFVRAPSCITEFADFYVATGFVSNRGIQRSDAGPNLVPNNLTLHLSWQAREGARLSRISSCQYVRPQCYM